MKPTELATSSHALLSVFAVNGIDRVFLVPGESYLGILDALGDFPQIDVVTCRHEGGAGFMACADGRLTRRPGVVIVSRGPGATNAAIAVHTAQQDAVPLILVVGQIPKADLRKEAFQEIDYQKMYGAIAKLVIEVTDPAQLATAAFKAVRTATAGTPGPVVLVVPEDIQQQAAPQPAFRAMPHAPTLPAPEVVRQVTELLDRAQRPLIIAGGALDSEQGRSMLIALAEKFHVPVALSFRQHDIFPNTHPLYAGELGLANPADQIARFHTSDLILALGTRLGDIPTQGYRFPALPQPAQTLVHVYPDDHVVGLHFNAEIGVVCDAGAFAAALAQQSAAAVSAARREWAGAVGAARRAICDWPASVPHTGDGVPFVKVVQRLAAIAPPDAVVCLDAGTFAAPVYRHFPFVYPQRLMAPLSGAMGYGTPSAVAAQLRLPGRRVICIAGDGGFMMTGNEMIAAVERQLPIVFIVSNNNCYGSIRIHQEREYGPAKSSRRHVGTTLTNPDFIGIARAFGVTAEKVGKAEEIDGALDRALAANAPYFIEVSSSLSAVLPAHKGD